MSSLQKDSNLLKMEKPEMKSYSIIVRPFVAIPCLLMILMSGQNVVNLSCLMLSSSPLGFKVSIFLEIRLNVSQSQLKLCQLELNFFQDLF